MCMFSIYIYVISTHVQSIPYLWFPATSTVLWPFSSFLHRKPWDTCAPWFGNIAEAFPLSQRFNILHIHYLQCEASHEAETEPTKLAAYIIKLLWARSPNKSLAGSLLLQEIKASFLRDVVYEALLFFTQWTHRWVTLNACEQDMYWGQFAVWISAAVKRSFSNSVWRVEVNTWN